MKIVIIGGGWAGCAAALSARKQGAEVTIYERTDLLLGLGNIGGIIRNNGRFTAAEELIAMGGGELIEICDKNAAHRNIDFPGHKHATLYDVNKIESAVRRYLKDEGVEIKFENRICGVETRGKKLLGVYNQKGEYFEGDGFVEATGGTGPMGNCLKYGNGCSMCILRCPAYGPRISITQACGLEDMIGKRVDGGYGAFSGSCKLAKDTLDPWVREKLDMDGVVILKVPDDEVNKEKLKIKVCQQYALDEFAENIVLLDTGHCKLMSSFYPLEKLRKIDGLSNVKYIDPYAGGKANSIRYMSVARRNNAMKAFGISNLFVAGEKSGLFVGHTEAICTGTLAGYNCVRKIKGNKTLLLSSKSVIGDLIAHSNYLILRKEDLTTRFTFAGAYFFNRMCKKKMYEINVQIIEEKIKSLGLYKIFSRIDD